MQTISTFNTILLINIHLIPLLKDKVIDILRIYTNLLTRDFGVI